MAGAIAVHQSFPEKVMRRKLGALLRTNDFHSNLTGYNGKAYRVQPAVKSVRMYLDRKEAMFQLPVGSDPQEVFKKSWIFQQVFGLEAELSMIDARTFMMSIYTTSVLSFMYNAVEIDQSLGIHRLPVYVGKDRQGDVVYDMVEHPHLLVAGETGSGKSAALRSILTTLIRNVDNLDLYCADLKRSEFHLFKGVARTVVYETHEVLALVTMLRLEMRRRGDILEAAGVAHVDDLKESLNYIILAIDEVALLKKEKDIMQGIEEISTIGRALGVYLVLSMQRPDAQVLDGKLKQNLTVRMALKHADGINSRITIDSVDAANIKDSEKGRMVLKLNGLRYVQGPNLGLSEAKELLKGYKSPLEIRQPQRASQESQDDIIELGVL
ncbi:FtsK/SpoIIIE domain-containing protein [Paenibacillus sp. FSL L8-0708]|uniref:FtsK/SpoIIIE domain-containing protein n=1 Tax=Paenibacillus sp. FSL L8-0708 TaxID=2975311 RepID=UPI0030FB824A